MSRQNFKASNNNSRCSLKELEGDEPLPTEFNWLEEGLKLPVYAQGFSDWCAIFSSVSAIEAAVQINKRGQPDMYDHKFSQQAIGACNTKSIKEAMYIEDIMEYVIRNGLTRASDVPFVEEVSW